MVSDKPWLIPPGATIESSLSSTTMRWSRKDRDRCDPAGGEGSQLPGGYGARVRLTGPVPIATRICHVRTAPSSTVGTVLVCVISDGDCIVQRSSWRCSSILHRAVDHHGGGPDDGAPEPAAIARCCSSPRIDFGIHSASAIVRSVQDDEFTRAGKAARRSAVPLSLARCDRGGFLCSCRPTTRASRSSANRRRRHADRVLTAIRCCRRC